MDLYLLSNTPKIFGSYWSFFTDVAAQINGIIKVTAEKLALLSRKIGEVFRQWYVKI